MKVRNGLGPLVNKFSYDISNNDDLNTYIIAQVIDIILDDSSEEEIGTVYWIKYNPSKESESEEHININSINRAIPLNPNFKVYPIKGEIILIFNLSDARVDNNKYYYLSLINIWNNPSNNQGSYFQYNNPINSSVNNLKPYNGDVILEGRFGNSFRLGSTNKINQLPNEWSKMGNEGDPIIIISNKLNDNSQNRIENINKTNSSLYITSTQNIPLQTDIKSNPIVKTINPDKYFNNSQIIGVADRITLYSKKDEILLYSKTNIGLYSKKIVNIDTEESIIFNSPRIFLGMNNQNLPDEPVLLGDKTIDLLNNVLLALSEFSLALSTSISTPEGAPMVEINNASIKLLESINNQISKLDSLKSKKVYTI